MNPLGALQAALAAEEAAIYGYGVAGAVLTGADRAVATAALAAHTLLRDRLTALISALGGAPVSAQPAYLVPFAVDTAATARRLAADLEQGVSGAAWDVIAAAAPGSSLRSLAIGWLAEAAGRATHWGAQQALPGQPAPAPAR